MFVIVELALTDNAPDSSRTILKYMGSENPFDTRDTVNEAFVYDDRTQARETLGAIQSGHPSREFMLRTVTLVKTLVP